MKLTAFSFLFLGGGQGGKEEDFQDSFSLF